MFTSFQLWGLEDVFDVKIIVENMIKSATGKAPDQNLEMDQLQKQLREKIGGKKYLLVLDGTWNNEWEKWVSLKELLVGGAKGSRIIVTTRSLGVTKITSFVKQLNPSQSLEEIGFGYFKDLVERSFFQEVEEDGFGDMRCKMHDLMHDLAESVAGMESSIIDSNKIASDNATVGTPNLSQETWDFVIANCRCLRVLDLQWLGIEMISPSIYKLKHLRYLDLSWNPGLKILPKSICKIQNLPALKLDGCIGLQELPKKIEKLVNLTHLCCRYCNGLTHMPRGIGKLTSLETLSMFVVDKDESHGGADLSELRLLNNLREELEIRNLGFPHPNLRVLNIGGWRGDAKFPSWLPLLTNLVTIYISGSNFKHLPSFAQFPCLKRLEIHDCTKLEYMDDNSPKGSQGEPQSFFPSLKHLSLWDCPNIKSWWRTTKPIDDDSNEDDTTILGTSTMAFPCLSSLTIRNCPLTLMPLYPSLDKDLMLSNTSSRLLKQTIKMNINAKAPSTSTSSLPLSKLKSFDVHNIDQLDTRTLKGLQGAGVIWNWHPNIPRSYKPTLSMAAKYSKVSAASGVASTSNKSATALSR
ncbi:hypothetical protein GOBAR_DD34867 [Gossypium barbadense]|nr:hypothetical protein GOBAR_DD34867 [Gossypium barbadense]